MRKTIAMALILLAAFSLAATDLVIPEAGDSDYMLLEGDERFIVDDTVFYKRAFDGSLLVERYSEGITMLTLEGTTQVIVFLNATREEIDLALSSLKWGTEKPVIVCAGSELTYEDVKQLNAVSVWVSDRLSNATGLALLRRDGVNVTLEAAGSILQFTEDGVRIIRGNMHHNEGLYVTCPVCSTVIYIP